MTSAGQQEIILIVLLAASAIALIIVLRQLWRMRRAVQQVTDALKGVGRGDFEVEVEASGTGPSAELGRAFNEAAHRLSDSRQQIAAYQRTLEERVQARTRELNEATARAVQMAQTDPLTGLPNRIRFTRELEEAIRKAGNDRHRLAVMFVDIDFFKNFNDLHGHEHGDLLLKTIAARLQAAVRSDDLVARLGGDEYVILLRKLQVASSETAVDRIARDVLSALRVPFVVAGKSFEIQASIGIAIYPRDGRSASELLKNADAAMYAAKQSGRGRFVIFSVESGQAREQQMRRETAIREGLANAEFFLVYQPQIDAVTGMPAGLEALMRWNRPGVGMVSPAEFIPLAEQLGLIKALGQRALEIACGQCLVWEQMDLHPRVSVNVSARQLEDPEWLDAVHDLLARTKISPHFIDLEITESTLVGNPRQTAEILKRLHAIGVSLTLDDFGTGYSSLSYLTQLPFDTIKIDRSFVTPIDQKEPRSIAQAIVALAHSLGMRVIAEGVETPLQMSILREIGVEEMQGFYFSKPLATEAVAPWWFSQMDNAKAWLEGQTRASEAARDKLVG